VGAQYIAHFELDPTRPNELPSDPTVDVRGSSETDSEGVEWLIFERPIKHPPSRWALILGDAVHNARSALDVLVYQLVLLNGKRPTKRTQFPIYDSPPTQRQRQTIDANLKGVQSDHAKRIRGMQPYKRPKAAESWKLATLGALDNIDKHRLVHPMFHREERGELAQFEDAKNYLHFIPPPPIGTKMTVTLPEETERIESDWLEVLRIAGVPPDTQVVLDWYGATSVKFGFPDVTLHDIYEIRSHVIEIVESFAPDFP
jgi:hypothetical protein